MKSSFFSVLFVSALLFSGGCMLFQNRYEEPHVYDLGGGLEKAVSLPCKAEFVSFRNLSGADRRFLVRVSGNGLVNDEFNRWLVSPELLLERFLRQSFVSCGDVPVKIRAVITGFEIDRRSNTAILSADFTLRSGGRSTTFSSRVQEPFSASGSAVSGAAAEAMKRCAAKLAGELEKNILLFLEKK